ncbi:hypothetical protein WJX81_002145 [Elliptochloris bilobata]|uniref:Beta-catenin-like protein 1 N-terminal domain-containing protein n=1 Tax=Elliptochloris bilobata TaxID=381761 RepID=A0AAW1RL58_9CHLO
MSHEAPTAVLQAAFSRLVDAHADAPRPAGGAAAFIATRGFAGRTPGYYFGNGPQGIGYYLDARQPQPAAEAEKVAEDKDEVPEKRAPKPVDAEALLREAEQQAGDQGQLLDSRGLKRLVLSFEKKACDNMAARVKHADAPERFMDTEVDLDEAVRQLQAVASAPELYPELIRLGAVPGVLALLGHENGDLAASVAELLRELTDADAVEDSEEEARELVAAMVEANGLESLVLRLGNLDEGIAEEDAAVLNSLSTLENMIELQPSVAAEVVQRTPLLRWLLKRLKPREFDSNKEAAGSLLALLLQTHPPNAQSLADINGIDALLQVIAPYKNRNPGSDDEAEYVENLFNALCCTLMSPAMRSVFVEAEGVELMVLILKQKRVARAGALKALDFAMTRTPAACERFVDHLGLRTLFSMFMGKSKVQQSKGEAGGEAEGEERMVSIVSSLMQGLARGSRRDRVAAKFVENEFEKCDRLMELYTRYVRRVRTEEVRLAAMPEEEAAEAAEAGEDYVLLARLGAGLYTLQQCALIMGHLWFVGDLGVRKRILLLLHQQGLTLAGVRAVLEEFHDSIGDEDGADEGVRARARVMRLLTALGWEAPEVPPPPPEELPANGTAAVAEVEANGAAEEDEDADPFGLGALPDKSSAKAHKSDRHGMERKRDRSNSGDEGRGKRDRHR